MTAPTRKRVRLPAEVRARHLLEAALVEFAEHGFTATRIEDIAHRAGLSKSGVYAHYASKEAIFEALLTHVMEPGPDQAQPLEEDFESVESLVDRFIDRIYTRMADPRVLGMLRLMVAESARVPALIQRWHAEFVVSFHRAQARTLARGVERGVIREGPLTEHFPLAYAPALSAAITQIVTGHDSLGDPALRDAHRRMMVDMLRPPGAVQNSSSSAAQR